MASTENAHTVGDLRQMQSLSLESKILMTKQRIQAWYDYWDGYIYISFSGGKDSTVLLDIARQVYPDIKAVYVDTGLEYPEVRNFVKSVNNVEWLHPVKWDKHKREYVRTNFKEVILEHGYPLVSKEIAECIQDAKKSIARNDGTYSYRLKRLNGELLDKNGKKSKYNCPKWRFLLDAPFNVSNLCCDIMKKNPTHDFEKKTGLHPVLGTLADESRLRLQKWLKNGCNAFNNKHPVSQPLSFWREQDILLYLLKYDKNYAEVYGKIIGRYKDLEFSTSRLKKIMEKAPKTWEDRIELATTGAERTGCMFCGFGCHLEKSPNRFQRMKETHPKQYEYCLRPVEQGGLGMAEVLDYIGVDYK